MSNSDLLSRLEQTLTPPVTQLGLYLEGVALSGPPNRRVLRVTVDLTDGPGGVGSDSLEQLTRAVSEILDEEDPLPGAYHLEVTTPGVDRPLTTARHFRRNTGRLVKITTNDEPEPETFTGRVVAAGEEGLTVETEKGERTVPLGDIAHAKVELEFRPRAKGAKNGN